jgi:hypothetical protein
VLIIAGLVTALVGARAGIDTLWPAPSASTSPTPTAVAQGVPNVYALDSATAITLIRNAGYVARTVLVCSDSITIAGKVRQVLSDDVAADGTVLVDAPGVTTAGRLLPSGAKVVLKVTTGARC